MNVWRLNGPGDFGGKCNYSWDDSGLHPVYRDLKCPSKVVVFLDNTEDEGKIVKVFGYDEQLRPLRTKVGENWVDGYIVPTIYGYALPENGAPTIALSLIHI